MGDWILDCGSGRELIDRFRRPRDTQRPAAVDGSPTALSWRPPIFTAHGSERRTCTPSPSTVADFGNVNCPVSPGSP